MHERPIETRSGPWLVALGAALWGTESAWRIPLNQHLSPAVIVFWEHVLLVLGFLPWIWSRLGELRRVSPRALACLVFSGLAGSAVGTVLFQLALDRGNETIVNLVLTVQPIFSTSAAVFLFGDRLSPRFFPWAFLAILAGALLSVEDLTQIDASWRTSGLDAGMGYALLCALCWGLSTVAGRGVMLELSLPFASGMRFLVGLVGMLGVLAWKGKLNAAALIPPDVVHGEVAWGSVVWPLVLLASVSGALPLLLYFQGLRHTRASTAGYFEMVQTLSAVAITWGFFGAALHGHQLAAAVVLLVAVTFVQRVQARAQRPA